MCCESDSKLEKLRFLETVNSVPEWGCPRLEFECCFLSVGSAKIGDRMEEFGA